MNSATADAPGTETGEARRPHHWLRDLGRSEAAALRLSGAFQLLDVLAAIGFAAGLALGVTSLAQGVATAAPWLALAALSAGLRGLLAMASARAGARAAAAIKSHVRRDAARDLLNRPAGDRRTIGEGMAAVVEGVEALDGYFARFVPTQYAAALAPLLIIAAVAVASAVAAGILLLTLIPFIVGMAFAGIAAADESRRQFQALSRLSGLFLDRIRGLPMILAFQAEDAQTARLSRAADELSVRTARVLRIAFVSTGILEFFAALSVALVAVYCGFNLLGLLPFPVPETLTLERAFFALALAPEVYAPMRLLAAAYHDRQQAEAAAVVLDIPAPIRAPTAKSLSVRGAPAIRFENVEVLYPDTDRPAVAGFDLEIKAGSIVALMGPSGAGKSTLLHLLLDLAPLTGGEIAVDDLRLSEIRSVAPLVAWAGQAPLVIPGTLADNIALARRDASREEIAGVAERVGLTGALAARPEGLSAWIDERGGGLSGGERRRLALARALLKPAPILLLDEPTANLDLDAAARLLPVIAEAARGRTTLIATHSEDVAALADRVVRL